MNIEQPGGHTASKTVQAAKINFDPSADSKTVATEVLESKDLDNGTLRLTATYTTTTYVYDAGQEAQAEADLAAGTFSNASEVITKTNTDTSRSNSDVRWGSGITAQITSSTGQTFQLQTDDNPSTSLKTITENFPDGTEFTLDSITFDPVTGYEGNFEDYVVSVRNTRDISFNQDIPVDGPGTVQLGVPFAESGSSVFGDPISLINVRAREPNEDGFVSTRLSFQPTPRSSQLRNRENIVEIDDQGNTIDRFVVATQTTFGDSNIEDWWEREVRPELDRMATSLEQIENDIIRLRDLADKEREGTGIITTSPFGYLGNAILYQLYVKQAQILEEPAASSESQVAALAELNTVVSELFNSLSPTGSAGSSEV